VEANVEILPTLNRILGFLQAMEGDKGMPKQDKLAETNIINSSIGDRQSSKNTLSSQEKNKTTEFAKIFSKIFVEIQNAKKPDTAEKTIVGSIANSQTKSTNALTDKANKENMKEGSLLLTGLKTGLMLIVGSLAALVYGLMNDGPFRGSMKILYKLGMKGGVAIIKNVISNAFKLFVTLPNILFGQLGKNITELLGELPQKFLKNIGEKFTKLIGGSSGNLGGRVLAKLEKNFLGKMAIKVLKPLSKVLTKIPIIGTLLSLGFAYARFKDGDIVGGIIDTVNALVGLLLFTPAAPLVLPIQIGLDVLNAWLDYKSDQGEGKPKLSKMDILGDMVKSIGGWLWENAKDIPLLGAFKYLGMTWDSFKGGKINESLTNLAYALIALIPGGGLIIRGIDGLVSFLNPDKKSEEPNLNVAAAASSLSSWTKSIGDWIWNNAEYIPLLGTFKYLGMTWDSFKSGNYKDALTNMARGLFSITPGGILMMKGIDGLMSFLSPSENAKEPNLNVAAASSSLSSWAKSIGDWIWTNGEKIPVISSFKYLSKAWDEFSSGNILKGLEYVARSVPGVDMLIQGYNMLSSLFSTDEPTDSTVGKTNTDWIGKVKDFIRSKMKELPMVLRKPLEWLGIISEDSTSTTQTSTMVSNFKDSANAGFEKAKGFFKNVWDGVGNVVSTKVGQIKSFAANAWNSLNVEGVVSTKVDQIKSFAASAWDSLKSAINPAANNNAQAIQTANVNVGERMATMTGVQTKRLALMISLSQQQLSALNNLVAIGNMSLTELRRMNSSSPQPSAPLIPNISESPTKDMVKFEDNRDGYFSSVYRLAP
jgi:hypothetical protein